jgi:hypothetical protein
MKQAIFLVTEYGYEGKGPKSIVYASTLESERDEYFESSPNKNFYSREDMVGDLDEIALKTWTKLNGLEKLSLERVDCPIWTSKPLSKKSI